MNQMLINPKIHIYFPTEDGYEDSGHFKEPLDMTNENDRIYIQSDPDIRGSAIRGPRVFAVHKM